VNEAFGSINEYKREVSDLTPQYKAATDEIKDLVARVEDQKEQYIAVSYLPLLSCKLLPIVCFLPERKVWYVAVN
jgi:hypothetical protein